MRKIHVNLGEKSYDILIERGLLARIGDYIGGGGKTAVITDETVNALYGDRVEGAIGGETARLVLPPGEGTKSFDHLKEIYDFLLKMKITRSDRIVALGGGVMGDLAGFAAATVLRGVPLIQIPTTLLAQVDSSVGGKVAINSPYGKNLIGAFYQPKIVLIDPDTLQTLPERVVSDGMAEVVKYGCIRDLSLFESLERDEIPMEEIILRCCDIKRAVVEADEFDTGERMILNFGHTVGHAVENYYRYERYTHGEAVAIGMVCAARLGEARGVTPPGTSARIAALLEKQHLPVRLDMDPGLLTGAMALDKKAQGEALHFIFLDRIGSALIQKLHKSEVVL